MCEHSFLRAASGIERRVRSALERGRAQREKTAEKSQRAPINATV